MALEILHGVALTETLRALVNSGRYESSTWQEIRDTAAIGYKNIEPWAHNHNILETLRKALGGADWSVFRGKKMLDIGCGGSGGDYHEPWLPFTLGLLGAQAYGLDIAGPRPGFNGYTHIQSNIARGGLDAMIAEHEGTFDVVTCFNVFISIESPTLRKTALAEGKYGEQVKHDVSLIAEHLLRPGGIFYWDIAYERELLRKDPEYGFIGT